MRPATVREIAEALTLLPEQDALLVAWTNSSGEVQPQVIDTGEVSILALSWDQVRGLYVLHMTSGTN